MDARSHPELIPHLILRIVKEKGVIDADYQIQPVTSRDSGGLGAQKAGEQVLRLTRRGQDFLRTRKTNVRMDIGSLTKFDVRLLGCRKNSCLLRIVF